MMGVAELNRLLDEVSLLGVVPERYSMVMTQPRNPRNARTATMLTRE